MTAGNRLHWIDEEMEILSRGTTYVAPPEDAWLKIRHRSHNARVLSALKALAAWRECRAREKNVPRQSILKDDFLVMIATACPKNKEQRRTDADPRHAQRRRLRTAGRRNA